MTRTLANHEKVALFEAQSRAITANFDSLDFRERAIVIEAYDAAHIDPRSLVARMLCSLGLAKVARALHRACARRLGAENCGLR